MRKSLPTMHGVRLDAIEEIHRRHAPNGRRAYMKALGKHLRDKGVSRRAVVGILAQENRERCTPPLWIDEMMRVVDSVFPSEA